MNGRAKTSLHKSSLMIATGRLPGIWGSFCHMWSGTGTTGTSISNERSRVADAVEAFFDGQRDRHDAGCKYAARRSPACRSSRSFTML